MQDGAMQDMNDQKCSEKREDGQRHLTAIHQTARSWTLTKRLLFFATALLAGASPASAVDVFVSTFGDGKIYKIDSETGANTVVASFPGSNLEDIVIDAAGIMYIGGPFTEGVKR